MALAAAVLLAACTVGDAEPPQGAPSATDPIRLVVFADLPPSIARSPDVPAFDGAEVAVERRSGREGLPPVVVELRDLTGDPAVARETLTEIEHDPEIVGAILAPFSDFPPEVLDRIEASMLPVISLSPSGRLRGSAVAPWRRIVAPVSTQARTFADFVRGLPGGRDRSCVAGPEGAGRLMPWLARALGGRSLARFPVELPPADEVPDPAVFGELAEKIDASGCRIAVWVGGVATGSAFRTALTGAGLGRVIVAGTDAIRSDGFIVAAGSNADGVLAACACVDLSTSTSIDAQRFVNDFQFTAGLSPGPYAAEGFDAANMVLDAVAAGGSDRAGVGTGLASMRRFDGLAEGYIFEVSGELAAGSVAMHFARVEAGRWFEIGTVTGSGPLDLPPEGVLEVASCRAGLPYAGGQHGRLRGFDVEVVRTIARRHALGLRWHRTSCSDALDSLRSGTVDVVVGSPVASGVAASRVYLSERQAVIVLAGDGIGDLDDIPARAAIGVVRGTPGARWARMELGPRGMRIRAVASVRRAIEQLRAGHVEAAILHEVRAREVSGRRGRVRVADTVGVGQHSVLLVAQERPGLLATLDAELVRLVRTGEYRHILDRWFPGAAVPVDILRPV
ncbi:MAG: transporter substrate-binding domain-containing protein [Actinomycetota bacterium]